MYTDQDQSFGLAIALGQQLQYNLSSPHFGNVTQRKPPWKDTHHSLSPPESQVLYVKLGRHQVSYCWTCGASHSEALQRVGCGRSQCQPTLQVVLEEE